MVFNKVFSRPVCLTFWGSSPFYGWACSCTHCICRRWSSHEGALAIQQPDCLLKENFNETGGGRPRKSFLMDRVRVFYNPMGVWLKLTTWINKVYKVTDSCRPVCISKNDRLMIQRHRDNCDDSQAECESCWWDLSVFFFFFWFPLSPLTHGVMSAACSHSAGAWAAI